LMILSAWPSWTIQLYINLSFLRFWRTFGDSFQAAFWGVRGV
jgi:hypothetical protein